MPSVKAIIDTNLVARAFIFTPKQIQTKAIPVTRHLIYAFEQDYFTWVWMHRFNTFEKRVILK